MFWSPMASLLTLGLSGGDPAHAHVYPGVFELKLSPVIPWSHTTCLWNDWYRIALKSLKSYAFWTSSLHSVRSRQIGDFPFCPSSSDFCIPFLVYHFPPLFRFTGPLISGPLPAGKATLALQEARPSLCTWVPRAQLGNLNTALHYFGGVKFFLIKIFFD